MNEINKIQLPYNVDIKLFEDIVNDLKSATDQNGIKLGTLWTNVSAAKNLNRSYTLNMAKYLGLVDSDKTNVWLTNLGLQSFKYASGDTRRTILVKQMSEEYLSMFKWIKNTGELLTSEIKGKFIQNYGTPSSSLILDKAIATFLTYCDYLKIIKYVGGKGNASKATVTDFGLDVLDNYVDEKNTPAAPDVQNLDKSAKQNKKLELPNGVYPIIIKTPDREIPYDIRTENDFKVIDTVIASIKDDWNVSQKKQPSEKEDMA